MSHLKFEGIGMTSQRTRGRLIERLRNQGVSNPQVLDVIATTPRHAFLDEALAHRAYEDVSLPIGFGQTLSQPYIVARMTEILLGAAGQLNRVLEVGTGSGYQTTVLAQLVPEVYTVERIKPLQDKARQRTRQLGLKNITFKHSDGHFGWPDETLGFDGILSTAAPRSVPDELKQQLAPGGVLVIPVGEDQQELQLIIREEDSDSFIIQSLEPVNFVPLLSGTAR